MFDRTYGSLASTPKKKEQRQGTERRKKKGCLYLYTVSYKREREANEGKCDYI